MVQQTLLTRAHGGDLAARDALFESHFERCPRRLNDDARQQAYLIGLRKLAEFRGQSSFATWLTSIAIRTAMADVRREDGRARGIGGDGAARFAGIPDRVPTPLEILMGKERSGRVADAVRGLRSDQREVVEPWLQGDRVAEIARRLQLTYSRVYTRLERALATLEARLPADL